MSCSSVPRRFFPRRSSRGKKFREISDVFTSRTSKNCKVYVALARISCSSSMVLLEHVSFYAGTSRYTPDSELEREYVCMDGALQSHHPSSPLYPFCVVRESQPAGSMASLGPIARLEHVPSHKAFTCPENTPDSAYYLFAIELVDSQRTIRLMRYPDVIGFQRARSATRAS